MIDVDKKPFSQLLGALGVATNREVTPALLRVYWVGLADLALPDVRRGVETCAKTLKFFPSLAELRDACRPAEGVGLVEARGGRIFERLCARGPHYDPRRGDFWRAEDVEAKYGPAAREAFEAAGGTAAFRDRRDSDMPFLRKAFLDAYRHAEPLEQRGELPTKYVPALPAGEDPRIADIRARLHGGRDKALPTGDAA